jgi:hypothetical protein
MVVCTSGRCHHGLPDSFHFVLSLIALLLYLCLSGYLFSFSVLHFAGTPGQYFRN